MGTRHGGVLLHPTSLPGPGPVGEIGPYAVAFLEWMTLAGLDTWQVLPLHPVGGGDSPYASPSAFAADPRLISVESLVVEGLIASSPMPWGQEAMDPEEIVAWKVPLLRAAAARVAATAECRAWVAMQEGWLRDWGLYSAASREHGSAWWTWGKLRRQDYGTEIAIAEGLQYLFAVQWGRLREAARKRGIRIVGDLPIFVSHDACDVWANRELFLFDADGRPDPVSGVPPDYFAPMGQRWANPMYDWPRHARGKYAWWKARVRRELDMVDAVRLDHFRGYEAAWAIPADEPDARNGKWTSGPGEALFHALAEDNGGALPFWAEDLGDITPEVDALRARFHLPGMKILQFAFGTNGTHPFLPHNYVGTDWIAYTGTHDNDTAVGWYDAADDVTRHGFRVYTGRDGSDPGYGLLREAWASVADTAIAPMQDFLRMGSEGRLNTPGVSAGNWAWRLRELPWTECGWINGMGEAFGR